MRVAFCFSILCVSLALRCLRACRDRAVCGATWRTTRRPSPPPSPHRALTPLSSLPCPPRLPTSTPKRFCVPHRPPLRLSVPAVPSNSLLCCRNMRPLFPLGTSRARSECAHGRLCVCLCPVFFFCVFCVFYSLFAPCAGLSYSFICHSVSSLPLLVFLALLLLLILLLLLALFVSRVC